MSMKPDVPKYTLQMRHPEFGWQTIAVEYTESQITEHFDFWVGSFPSYSFSMRVIGDVPQSWRVLKDHTGTHEYQRWARG